MYEHLDDGVVRTRVRPATTTAYRWVFAGTASVASTTSQPFTVRVVTPRYRTNPVCATKRCTLLAIRGEAGPFKLQLEVIGLPLAKGASETLRMQHLALYDRAGRLVYMSPKYEGAYAGDMSDADVDKAGRIFLPYAIGANVEFLVVLDTGVRPFQTYGSLTPTMRFEASDGVDALDVTGDGINEIVLIQSDFIPSHAAGTEYAFYYTFRSRSWRLIGCTKLVGGAPIDAPPTIAPGRPGCYLNGQPWR